MKSLDCYVCPGCGNEHDDEYLREGKNIIECDACGVEIIVIKKTPPITYISKLYKLKEVNEGIRRTKSV